MHYVIIVLTSHNYKGLETLGEIKKKLVDYEVCIIGKDHKVLSSLDSGKEYFKKLKLNLSKAGVKLMGYKTEANIKKLVRSYNCVGILPYKYTSGSSFSAVFMMNLGLPIVTSYLDEFLIWKERGAGIICTADSSTNYAEIINFHLDYELSQLYFWANNRRNQRF